VNAAAKATRTKALRYKRPALKSLGYEIIDKELDEIATACSDVQYYMGDGDDTLLNALDGEEDEEYEFRMAFSDLIGKTEQLREAICNSEVRECFDDCTVGLIGNRYTTIGYDMEEEDYFGLTSYEQGLAYTLSGKRLMAKTKPEMLSTIGQCVGIIVAFLDIRQTYDYLKVTMDILRDENTSLLSAIKAIEVAYELADKAAFSRYDEATREFNSMIANLPERTWIE
jgi:hypothetical protein